jgi:hypothetical protein
VSMVLEDKREAARGRLPAGQALRALGLGARLIPSAVFQLIQGHRRFGKCFVREAVRHGLPEEAAREMVRDLRPAKLIQSINEARKDR